MIVDVSYKTPMNDKAERPPLRMVPGQRDGEKRNANVANKKQLNPTPAL